MEEEATMKALVLDGPLKFAVKRLPIPKPADGEVLIKVMAAPINPSDLIFIQQGAYDSKKVPCVPGFEGSGVVIASGGGLVGWGLVDKRVAFTPTLSSGTYGQYALAKAGECMPIEDSLSFQHGSMSFVNPLTAMALLQKSKEKKTNAVIANAAASSLGRMINRLFPPEGIQVINIVRKEQQVEVLRKEGANYILNSSDPEFEQKLTEMATRMKATVCFDAIGGTMTGRMLNCMPKHSIVYVYGALDGPKVNTLDVKDFIYNDATVTGFFLPNWLQGKGIFKMLPTMIKLRKYLRHQLKSDIAQQCSLEEFESCSKEYMKNMTKGKVIIKPYKEATSKEAVEENSPMRQEDNKQSKMEEEDKKQENKEEKMVKEEKEEKEEEKMVKEEKEEEDEMVKEANNEEKGKDEKMEGKEGESRVETNHNE